MFLYGSTIMASASPLFFHDDNYHILPRPYVTSRPRERGWYVMKQIWMIHLAQKVECIVKQYVSSFIHLPDSGYDNVYNNMVLSEKKIPLSCRICGTFFTHISILGDMEFEESCIPPHFDTGDIITAVLHIGNNVKGGNTIYYDGDKTNNGNVCGVFKFKNGQLQIGVHSAILHSVSKWKGNRGTIIFTLKEKVLEHFEQFGTRYYDQWAQSNFQKGLFICD